MKTIDKDLYGVKYSGNLLDGFTIKEAVILLQKNARMNIETIKRLISFSDTVIKKNISLEMASNLVKILRGCGLDCSCISMQQNMSAIEQKTSKNITGMLQSMSNDDICNVILSLGNSRAKEIAFAVMKETTKDTFGSLKGTAEEKLSSFIKLSQKMVAETEKSNNNQNFLKKNNIVQILKKILTPKRIIVIGIILFSLILYSFFFKSSDESDIAVTPDVTPRVIPDSQPRGNERYDTNQLSRIK